jgi:protein transport protein SEC39
MSGEQEEGERGLEQSVESLASEGSGSGGGQQRVRKRDMVASAVEGGLTRGLGWVLGAPQGQ